MKKILGILGLFLFVFILTTLLNPQFLTAYNLQNVVRWSSLFAIWGIGVGFVIITGGIDLSIGSLIGLVGVVLPMTLTQYGWPVPAALALCLGIGVLVGLAHGLLITRLRLQPFVVTLCGLLIYRGVARWISADQTQGFGSGFEGLRWLATGKPFSIPIPFLNYVSQGNFSRYKWDFRADQHAADSAGNMIPLEFIEWVAVPMPFLIMVGIAIIAAVFLNYTIWGRYLLALGRNEQAARYSGIRTDRMVVLAYVLCSTLGALGGILFALDSNTVQPAGHGNFYELYAIAAAVLGGCSLRGGEGSILGIVIGAAVMRLLYNSINVLGIPSQLEFSIIGAVILGGVIVDELVKRYAARRRAARQGAG